MEMCFGEAAGSKHSKSSSTERYHCNPIMDALGLERSARRPATGYHSWLFVCALRRITL